jgi:hypothetical protein
MDDARGGVGVLKPALSDPVPFAGYSVLRIRRFFVIISVIDNGIDNDVSISITSSQYSKQSFF